MARPAPDRRSQRAAVVLLAAVHAAGAAHAVVAAEAARTGAELILAAHAARAAAMVLFHAVMAAARAHEPRQQREAALLPVVEALIERRGRVGDALLAVPRVVIASARRCRRSTGPAAGGSLCSAARRSMRSLADSRKACSKAGQVFSWSGLSRSPACSAAMRASTKAPMSSGLGRQMPGPPPPGPRTSGPSGRCCAY